MGLLRHTLAEVGCEALFCRKTKVGVVKADEMTGMYDDHDMEFFYRTYNPNGRAFEFRARAPVGFPTAAQLLLRLRRSPPRPTDEQALCPPAVRSFSCTLREAFVVLASPTGRIIAWVRIASFISVTLAVSLQTSNGCQACNTLTHIVSWATQLGRTTSSQS